MARIFLSYTAAEGVYFRGCTRISISSYGDETADGARVGFDNDFTQHNTAIMTWNCMHLARMLKEAGGIPNEGNDREAWKAGKRIGFDNPNELLG